MHVPIFMYYHLYFLTSMDIYLLVSFMNTVKLKFSLLLEILQAFKFHSLTEDNIYILSMLFSNMFSLNSNCE